MFVLGTVAVVLAMALVLARAILGPTLYDRVLAVNSFGTKTVLLLGLIGFLTGRPDFLDIALLYALLNFVATIAILKFFRYAKLAPAMTGFAPTPERQARRRLPAAGGLDLPRAHDRTEHHGGGGTGP